MSIQSFDEWIQSADHMDVSMEGAWNAALKQIRTVVESAYAAENGHAANIVTLILAEIEGLRT